MHLVAAGLSFRTAPLDVRERAAVSEDESSRLLRYLVGHCGLRGAAVLSTCNRTEFYVSCPTRALADEVRPRLSLYLDPVGDGAVGEHLMELRDAEAIRHMLRVAGGLESMVVGEAQVLGQFRDAHRVAREAGTLDARLDYVMRRAVSAGKRVRTETDIGRSAGSMADGAVLVASDLTGGLAGRTVLLLGAGSMGVAAGQRLQHEGARVLVASRGGDSATALAASLGATAAAVTDPVSVAEDVDVVICSTNSTTPLLDVSLVARMQERRGGRRLGIVDIAVPRDVDPAAAAVPGVELVDVDAVGERIAATGQRRRAALAEATAIIEAEVAHTVVAIGERDAAGPTIGALVRSAEATRRREVERTLSRMPGVDATTVARIQQLSRSLVSKLLHAPISHLRENADDPGAALTLRDAFDLDATTAAGGEAAESDAAAS